MQDNNRSSTCRACMQTATKLFGLETAIERGGTYTLQEFFVFTTQLQMKPDDGLPHNVCRECKNELQTFYQFVQTARKSDIMLREKKITVKTEMVIDLEDEETLLPNVIEELKVEETEDNFELQTSHSDETHEPQDDPIDTNPTHTRKSPRKSTRNKRDTNYRELDYEDVHFEEILLENMPKVETTDREDEPIVGRTRRKTSDSTRTQGQYSCSQCSERFSTLQEQWKHVGKWHKNIFMCKYCGMVFKKRHLHQEHLSEHNDIAPFPCEQCDKKFFTKRCLTMHTKQTHSEKKKSSDLPCSICGKGFQTDEQLQCHLAMHSCDKSHSCNLCADSVRSNHDNDDDATIDSDNDPAVEFTSEELHNADTTDEEDESIHDEDSNSTKKATQKQKGQNTEQLNCKYCPEIFSTLFDLGRHVGKCHKNIFMCKFCGLEFETRHLQKIHLLEHDDLAPFPCQQCDKKYFTKRCLTMHTWEAHLGRNPSDLPCSLCGKGYPTKEQLQCHYAWHAGDKNHSCEFCDDRMDSKNANLDARTHEEKPAKRQYRRNRSGVRDSKKIFHCQHCPQKFSTLRVLSNHVGKWHKDIIMCKYCGKEFESRNLRRLHLTEHPDLAPHACDQCDQKFFTTNGLKGHKETVHMQTNPACRQCSICAKVFETRQQLECHYPIHTGDKDHSCELCANSERSNVDNDTMTIDLIHPKLEEMPNAETTVPEQSIHQPSGSQEMLSTSQKERNSKFKYHCRLCPKQCSTTLELARHIGRWHKHILMCKFCGKEFDTQKARRVHLLEHKDATPYQCKYCDKAYFSHSGLRIHTNEAHLGKGTANFLCTICGRAFANKHRLEAHYPVHSEVKPFACDMCERRFTTVVLLRMHLRSHNGTKPYTCKACGKGFIYSNSLRVHERVHLGKRPFKCTVCGKGFKHDRQLKTHMTLHTGKTVQCTQCDRLFSHRSYMLKHLRNHSVERPYMCTVCPQTFTKNQDLISHINVQHPDENIPMYTCNMCSKKYLNKDSLEKHMYEHEAEKPFNCQECGMGFNLKTKYRKHLLDAHSIHLMDDNIEDAYAN